MDSTQDFISNDSARTGTNQDIVRRMRWGGVFYVVCSGAAILLSPALAPQSLAYLFIVLFIFLAALRLAVFKYTFDTINPNETVVERAVMTVYLATAISWSAFFIWVFDSIKAIDNGAAMAVISTAGIMSGGIAATSPRIGLMLAFAILLYLPSLLSIAWFLPPESGWILFAVGFSYFVFSIHNGKLQHDNYWTVRRQAIMLEQQAVDLEHAKVQAEEASKAKSAFLAAMSHEIRTPMNGVLGMTEILGTTSLNAQQQNYLNVIGNSGRTLLRIIDDILDFAKIEARKFTIVERAFNLQAMIDEIDLLFRTKSTGSTVSFITRIDCDVSRTLIGDPDRIKQILFNLLGNAFKFTEHGSVQLLVRCLSTEDRSGVELELTVKDSGIGISAENQARLFQEFIQVGESAQHIRGAGLGLVITKNLVTLMGGTISVSSTLGEGTEFRVRLPLRFDTTSVAVPQSNTVQPKAAINAAYRARILVVEDNEVNQMVTKAMLDRLNCEVIVAENGLEAVNVYIDQKPDLILMDCNMPVMDGFEATRQIRVLEQQNQTKHIPIVALTAHALEHIKQECLTAGMDDHLSKPFNFQQIDQLLQQYIPLESKQ